MKYTSFIIWLLLLLPAALGAQVSDKIFFQKSSFGIGTSSPASLLHITSASNPTLTIGTSNANTQSASTLQFFAGDGNVAGGFKMQYYRNSAGHNRLDFLGGDNSSTPVMTLRSTGLVGVGTQSPAHQLHVAGTNPTLYLEGDGVSARPAVLFKSIYGPSGTAPRLTTEGAFGWGLNLLTSSANNVAYRIQVGATGLGGLVYCEDPGLVTQRVVGMHNQTTNLFEVRKVNTGNGADIPYFIVNKNGQTGIGDNISGTDLYGYKLAVKGKIICEEAVVKLYADWPDFVFEPGYRLQPLSELAGFVRANRHLPGIPPAKAMAAGDGIPLARMTTKLLEKVEELTLYAINADRENSENKRRIQELEQRLQTLEQRMAQR